MQTNKMPSNVSNASKALVLNANIKFQLACLYPNPTKMREPDTLKILFGEDLYKIFDSQKKQILQDLKLDSQGNFAPWAKIDNHRVVELLCRLEQYYVDILE